MAFEKTKTYKLNGKTLEQVANAINDYLDNDKKMITQILPAANGFVVQCKGDEDAEWTKYLGADAALSTKIYQDGDMVTITATPEKWANKAGFAAAGFFIFLPLLITAGIGTARVSGLATDIIEFCDRYLGEGVTYIPTPTSAPTQASITCPSCGATNKAGAKFCSSCGSKLEVEKPTCPSCGAQLDGDEAFCPFCGNKMS